MRKKLAVEELQIPLETLMPDVANLQLPNPQLFTYYRNLENRTFYIDCPVTEDLIEISKEIILINREDQGIPVEERKPIFINIYTYGGDADAAFSLIGVMLASKTPVYTVNMGVAMSAGFLILLGGHKRFCTKGSYALYHSGSADIQGTFEQVETNTDHYKKMVKDMRTYIMDRTQIDTKLMNKMKTKDWYISDEEQIKYGICHEVVDNLDMIM